MGSWIWSGRFWLHTEHTWLYPKCFWIGSSRLYRYLQTKFKGQGLFPSPQVRPPLLEWRVTLVFVSRMVCTGVETDLYTIPSHPVLGEPQGISTGMLMNNQPTSTAASHSILTSLYPPTSTKMMTKAAAVAQKARIMHALWIWIQKAQLMEKR